MTMANMSLKKNPMPSQDPNVRNKNFDEVALGYTEEMAIDEAQRCLNCKNPKCVNGCPVNVHIPEFIAKVAEGKFDEAYGVITSTNSLPAICGRVCPQENQCEGQCIRGIKGESVGIGRLERFVADYHNAHGHKDGAPAVPERNGHKVAVVGSGPAGLTCAGDLARKGYDVTVFEALHQVGGVLVYGIPEFRLPKAIVAKEVARLEHFGVKIMTDTVVGRTITVDELMDEMGFDPRRWPWWAAATWPWTPPGAPSAWGPRSTSSTAAAWRSCPPATKRWSTPRRRASSSRPSATRWRSWPMKMTT